jgi:integrase
MLNARVLRVHAILRVYKRKPRSKQEILDLQWADIDFEFKNIGLITLYRTKNKRKRIDLLMPRTKMALMHWKDQLQLKRQQHKIETIKTDYVFCLLDGTKINSFNGSWWKALEIAGIRNFHFHDLRHTFCSNLILSGSNLKEVKEMIGHNDIAMTDRYSHITNSFREYIQKLLAEHYERKN